MSLIDIKTPPLPEPCGIERIEKRVDAVMTAWRGTYKIINNHLDLDEMRALLAQVDAAMKTMPKLLEQVADLSRPATTKEIADRLSLVFICFHNSNGTPDGLATLMIDRVSSRQPSIIVLDQATRKIIDTMRFLPKPAEVLSAIDAAEYELNCFSITVTQSLPRRRAELLQAIESEEHALSLRRAIR